MSLRISSGFSHLRPEAFHIALQTHKTQHTQSRRWKKRTNKVGLRLAPSATREKSVTLLYRFLCIWLSQACIRAKFLHSHQERWHPLALANPFSGSTGPNSLIVAAPLWPSPSHNFCLLISSVHCHRTLHSLVFFRSRRESRPQALSVGFAPKRTKRSSDWQSPTPTETNATYHATFLQNL